MYTYVYYIGVYIMESLKFRYFRKNVIYHLNITSSIQYNSIYNSIYTTIKII